jgi:hypothetical protein
MFLSLDSANLPPETWSCRKQQLRLGSIYDSGTNTRKTIIDIGKRLSKCRGTLVMMVLGHFFRP